MGVILVLTKMMYLKMHANATRKYIILANNGWRAIIKIVRKSKRLSMSASKIYQLTTCNQPIDQQQRESFHHLVQGCRSQSSGSEVNTSRREASEKTRGGRFLLSLFRNRCGEIISRDSSELLSVEQANDYQNRTNMM